MRTSFKKTVHEAAVIFLRYFKLIGSQNIVSLLVIGLLQLFAFSDAGKTLEQNTSVKAVYLLKTLISPEKLDERIRIFAFDDQTAAGIKDFDVSLQDWSIIIESIAARKPAHIIIDKLFDKHYLAGDIEKFSNEAKKWSAPVSIISFVHKSGIPFRDQIPSDRFPTIEPNSDLQEETPANYLYGTSAMLGKAFHGIGHAVYNGDGRATLFYRIGLNSYVPHVALSVGSTSVNRSGLSLAMNGDKRLIPTGKDNSIAINFSPKNVYEKRALALLPVINRSRLNMEITPVNEGDFVLILPGMYTGNTDWRETPLGSMPGGYHVAAMVNSAIKNSWILEPSIALWLPSLFGLFVIVASKRLRPIVIIASSLAMSSTIAVACTIAFSAFNCLLPFSLTLLCIAATTVISYVAVEHALQIDRQRIFTEVASARVVQQAFFPKNTIKTNHIKIKAYFEPASECGGDWWGHRTSIDGQETILIGDAVGHGISAALVTAVAFAADTSMAEAKDQKNNNAKTGHHGAEMATEQRLKNQLSPTECIANLNRVLFQIQSKDAQMTFQSLTINTKTAEFFVASAGHTFPILIPALASDDRLKSGRRSKTLLVRGDFLGQEADSEIGCFSGTLRLGDQIVLYTDGITENRGLRSKFPLGTSGLAKLAEKAVDQKEINFAETLIQDYLSFIKGTAPKDDATIVVVEYLGSTSDQSTQLENQDSKSLI